MSELRLRKHHRQISTDRINYEQIANRIDKLKEEDNEKLKKQEIAMKSKMKTKIYKNLMRSLGGNGYSSIPAQRLYFKPPLSPNAEVFHETSKLEMRQTTLSGENQNFKSANDEIENLMDLINLEMKDIDFEMGVTREKTLEALVINYGESTLAKSTLKTVEPQVQIEIQKKVRRSIIKQSTTGPKMQAAVTHLI